MSDNKTITRPVTRVKTERPKLHKVILLNDDYTPMDFVVQALQGFFGHNQEKAVQIMLAIHQQGKGIAGIYPVEIAETKADLIKWMFGIAAGQLGLLLAVLKLFP